MAEKKTAAKGAKKAPDQAVFRPMDAETLFSSAGIALERMPMLRNLLEQLRSILVAHVGQLSTAQVVTTLESMKIERAGRALTAPAPGDVISYFEAPGWDSMIAVQFERTLLTGLVEAALGGDRSEPAKDEDRALSRLEMRLTAAIAEKVMSLEEGFEPIGPLRLNFAKLERRRDSTGLGPESAQLIVVTYRMETLYRGGLMRLLIPQTALLPLRALLSRAPNAVLEAGDPQWTMQMKQGLQSTSLPLSAILEEREMTLADIARLEVGQVLGLDATPRSRVRLTCRGATLFWCALGQTDGAFTLRVEECAPPDTAAGVMSEDCR